MRYIFVLPLLVCLIGAALAQNCDRTSTGFPPINDLGKGYYRGYQGGLYPGGENYAPDKHLSEALDRGRLFGYFPSMGTDKTIMISIGMSNTTQESQAFLSLLDTFSLKSPSFQFIDCAQEGMDVTAILSDSANYWKYVEQQLTKNGVTPAQVGVIWFKEAEASPSDTIFPHHADTLIRYYTTILQHLQRLCPNVQLCYLSSRIYAGYATSNLNPEPFAYESGWAVKWLIEKQINGDTSLEYRYSSTSPKVPLLLWGPYLWADGTTPRSDGLTWVCPDDFQSDGTHPSAVGRLKVAQRMLDFFSHNVTSIGWFGSSSSTFVLQKPSRDMLMPSLRDTFSWQHVVGAARYIVELSQDVFEASEFTPIAYTVADTILALDSLTIPQMQAPVYYVRIYAVDSNDRVIAKTGTSFWYRPWRPQIIAPRNLATNVSAPVLQWSTPIGPTGSFYVKLSDDPLLTHVLHERIVTSSTGRAYDTVSGLSSNSKYYWSVLAQAQSWSDYYDHPDIWSDTVSFTTGEISAVNLGTPTVKFALRYGLEPSIDYHTESSDPATVYSVDVLGRETLVTSVRLTSPFGSITLSPRHEVLFYLIRTPSEQYVLRAAP